MDEKLLALLIAELRDAQGEALGLLTQALCQQIDPAKLTADLQRTLTTAKTMRVSALAIGMATHAMAAAEAEKMLQARPPSEGPHPKRDSSGNP